MLQLLHKCSDARRRFATLLRHGCLAPTAVPGTGSAQHQSAAESVDAKIATFCLLDMITGFAGSCDDDPITWLSAAHLMPGSDGADMFQQHHDRHVDEAYRNAAFGSVLRASTTMFRCRSEVSSGGSGGAAEEAGAETREHRARKAMRPDAGGAAARGGSPDDEPTGRTHKHEKGRIAAGALLAENARLPAQPHVQAASRVRRVAHGCVDAADAAFLADREHLGHRVLR